MRSIESMTAQEVIDALALDYLDGEGVWIRVLWRTPRTNAIHCLLTPDDFSGLHRLREDESWVHVAGAPVEMLLLHDDGSHELANLGPDLAAGERPAVLAPAGSWQGSRTRGPWSLVVCTLAPPFTAFELADDTVDLAAWPEVADHARGLIRG